MEQHKNIHAANLLKNIISLDGPHNITIYRDNMKYRDNFLPLKKLTSKLHALLYLVQCTA